MRLDAVELGLSGALTCANLSAHSFRSARPFLRPINAVEERLIGELIDSGVEPKIIKHPLQR